MIRHAIAETSLGPITLVASGEAITGLYFRHHGDIATELGDGHYAQEVGKALDTNPICIAIPCHRVVAADGSLTGYAGGLRRKRALLELEAPAPESVGRLF